MRGQLTAPTAVAVQRDLEARGLVPIEVESAPEVGAQSLPLFGRRRGVLEFTRAVAALLPAGMPLARCLSAGAATAPGGVRPALDAVRSRVERGDELADALAAFPGLFPPLYVGIVRAGEKSGSLDSAFERLADYLERDDELRSKLVSMAIYPALLAVVGVAAVLLLVLFVLPRFAELLESSGAALPRMTSIMLTLVTTAQANWVWIVVSPVVLGVAFLALRSTEVGREVIAKTFIRIPLVGGWRRQALGARFGRILGELLAGGAPLLASLADVRDSVGDPVIREEAEIIRNRVREGSSLHVAIAERGIFPRVLSQLVSLGEESGRLAEFTLKAAEMLERQTQRSLERLVTLAEPAMIVAFGGIVGVVALALLQAIYGVNAGSF
jgi:type II secretory pathway component PulF